MSRRDEEFTAYVAERRAHLYRTAYLLCAGDGHRAEDVVQQALTKLYAAWPRVSRLDSIDAYARRVVVNAHLDDVRRPWRRERPVATTLERPATSGLSVEDADALWSALRGLAPGQRRVVVLRHYLGLSVEETAADLGVSAGTVKSQTSDALGLLRAALKDGASR
ncbi:SigE family RNA polymerase sigma factor [Nocardioides sp.]|uniref:SigE family RNA polymerase sigma factor n=1 Tax=Nocardioides sp. TaxID=35761 RepID=UPI002724C142|nr:SigE family RNA polymerase sigma factor [Nocardioides sp.]MDO9455957.1 SigE family RNA polymerase sigma factor [Nocardioides sp.]